MKNFANYICTLATAVCLLTAFGQREARAATSHSEERTVDVLLGPCGSASARGPAGTNDDYTNRSINSGLAPNGLTASPAQIVFKNTVENTGSDDDAFSITTRSAPSGFQVELSTDFGAHYTSVNGSGNSVTIPVAYRAGVTFLTRITAPAGLKALAAYEVVISATSTTNPTVMNETIDRLYTGFIRLEMKVSVVGVEGDVEIAHARPGSELEFAITYTNISSATGIGNSLLTAHDLVINQNGKAAPNSWGYTTEHIVGASDNQIGYILGDREGSTSLTDMVPALEAGQSGVFKFRRRIK